MVGKILNHTDEMIALATERDKKAGIYRNSVTEGEGRIHGFIAEQILADYLGRVPIVDDYNFDIIYSGMRLEVKAKPTTVIPREGHSASVGLLSQHQECDRYVFFRIKYLTSIKVEGKYNREYKGLEKIYLMGDISKKDFWDQGTLHKQGDKEGNNGFITHKDMMNINYSQLINTSILYDPVYGYNPH